MHRVFQMILSEPEEITTMGGQKFPLKCSVDYISFSAHTDCNQTTDFIRELRPPHVVSNWRMHQEMGEEDSPNFVPILP